MYGKIYSTSVICNANNIYVSNQTTACSIEIVQSWWLEEDPGFTHHLGINYYVNFLGRLGSNEFQLKRRFGTHDNWKNKNPGDRFGDTR